MKRISISFFLLFMVLCATAQGSILGIGNNCQVYNSKRLAIGLFESLGDSLVLKLLDIYQHYKSPFYYNIPFTCEINSRGEIHSITLTNRGEIAKKVISAKDLLRLKKYLNRQKLYLKVCYEYDPFDKENVLSAESLNNKFKQNKYLDIIVYFPSLLLRNYNGISDSIEERLRYLRSIVKNENNDFY